MSAPDGDAAVGAVPATAAVPAPAVMAGSGVVPASARSGITVREDGTFLVDRSMVGNCFGCGPTNAHGLRLRFRLLDDGRVATTVEIPPYLCGVEGVVHGGIQATILDEVSGVAAQLALPEGASTKACVTAELALRFHRPVSQHGPVTAVARATGGRGRSILIDAAIVDDDGETLTSATSRWVQLT